MNFPDQHQQREMPYFDPLQSYHNSQDFGILEPPGRHFEREPNYPPSFIEPLSQNDIPPQDPPKKVVDTGISYLRITAYILLLLTALFMAGWYYDK